MSPERPASEVPLLGNQDVEASAPPPSESQTLVVYEHSEDSIEPQGSFWSLLLLLLPVTAAFAHGFQSISVLTPINLSIWLSLIVQCNDRYDFLFVTGAQNIGTFVAYMQLFGTDAASIATVFVAISFQTVVFTAFVATPYKLLQARYGFFESNHVILYPISYTAFYCVSGLLLSTLTNPAYAFREFRSLFQVIGLFGLDGVNFIVAWGVSHFVTATVKDNSELTGTRWKSLRKYFAVVVVLLAFNAAASLSPYGSFFQRNIVNWQQGDDNTINAVCAVGYHSNVDGSIDQRLATTKQLAEKHMFLTSQFQAKAADIILWSEASTSVPSQSEERRFLAELGNIARDNQVLIGGTYELILSDNQSTHGKPKASMFALVLSNGEVAFKYKKVHSVFMLESFNTEEGKTLPPVVNAGRKFGRIGGALGFDFDFPDYIKGASQNADLMLHPSQDWDTIGSLHAQMASARAIENGFTLFRCSSSGVSGAYSPYGDVVSEKVTGTAEGQTAVFATQIPRFGKRFTLFSIIGSGLGYLCVLLNVVFIILAVMPQSCATLGFFSMFSPKIPEEDSS